MRIVINKVTLVEGNESPSSISVEAAGGGLVDALYEAIAHSKFRSASPEVSDPSRRRRKAVTTRTTFLAPILSIALTGAFALVFTKAVNAGMEQPQGDGEKSSLAIRLNALSDPSTLEQTDPEFVSIRTNFIDDVHNSGSLTDEQRALITIVTLTTQQALPQLRQITHQALKQGVSPLVIRESVYLAAAFIGFPKTENAVAAVNGVFAQHDIALPLVQAGTVSEDKRYEEGLSVQSPIYGNEIANAMRGLPGRMDEDIPRFLTELLFGDFYTREGLDLKMRELLSLSILATLGAEEQIRAHAIGNLKVGNDRATLIAAMVQCLPYIGFPYMFNAINTIRSVEWAKSTERLVMATRRRTRNDMVERRNFARSLRPTVCTSRHSVRTG